MLRDRRLNHRPEVVGGVLEAECAALMESFFAGQRAPVTSTRSRSCGSAPYAVIVRDGAVLLARWIGSDPPRWTLPGGGLDHGEDPRDAAVREVEEETGYRVELRQLLTVESFRQLLQRPDGPVDHQTICHRLHGGGRRRGAAAARSAAARTSRRGSRWPMFPA